MNLKILTWVKSGNFLSRAILLDLKCSDDILWSIQRSAFEKSDSFAIYAVLCPKFCFLNHTIQRLSLSRSAQKFPFSMIDFRQKQPINHFWYLRQLQWHIQINCQYSFALMLKRERERERNTLLLASTIECTRSQFYVAGIFNMNRLINPDLRCAFFWWLSFVFVINMWRYVQQHIHAKCGTQFRVSHN